MNDSLHWLKQALSLSGEGRYPEAHALLDQHLEHPGALHLKGLIELEQGQYEASQKHLEQALKLGGSQDIHLLLARSLSEREMFEQALGHFEKAQQLKLLSEDADLHRYALCLHALGDFVNALNLYQQLLHRHPEHAELWMHVGNALLNLDRVEAALEMFRQGLAQNAESPLLHFNYARALLIHSDYKQARVHLEQCLESNTEFAPAWQLMAMLEQESNQFEAAVSSAQRAHHLNPHEPDFLNTLGACYKDAQAYEQARQSFEKVLSADPHHLEARLNLAELHRLQNRSADADAQLQQLLLEYPAAHYLQALNLPIVYRSQDELEHHHQQVWEKLDLLKLAQAPLRKPLFEIGQTPFYLPYSGLSNTEIKNWLVDYNHILRRQAPSLRDPYEAPGSQNKKLRLALLSSHFSAHTVMGLFGHLFESLSRDDFELVCLSIPVLRDEQNQKIRQQADRFIELPHDLEQARDLIRATQVDVLVFLDHGLHPLSWFLGHFRMAPIQMQSWGHGITSGQEQLDYFVSNALLETPGSEAHYSEQLLRLPQLLGVWRAPEQFDSPADCRQALGLDPDKRLYLCPQTPYKLHPDFDPYLFHIADADAQGQIVLIEPECQQLKLDLQTRWGERLRPEQQRWLPRLSQDDYLRLLRAGNVMLDTRPFGGGITMMQALSLGTPLVTQEGTELKNRLAYGVAQQIQWDTGLVNNEKAYVDQAVELAQTWRPEDRHALQKQYAEQMDAQAAGAALGECILELWEGK